MKRYRFFLDKQVPTVRPLEEIIEFEDDTTDEEIEETFNEWVFNELDTCYEEINEEE